MRHGKSQRRAGQSGQRAAAEHDQGGAGAPAGAGAERRLVAVKQRKALRHAEPEGAEAERREEIDGQGPGHDQSAGNAEAGAERQRRAASKSVEQEGGGESRRRGAEQHGDIGRGHENGRRREQAARQRQHAQRQTLRQHRQGETGGQRGDAGAPAGFVERRGEVRSRRRGARRAETGQTPGPRRRRAGLGETRPARSFLFDIVVAQDAIGGAVEILILVALERPEQAVERQQAERQRGGNEKDQNIHALSPLN